MFRDPFDGLHVVLAVARHQSFTAAAAELGVTPAAISQKIRVVEARLGVLLFARTTRRVRPTEAGAALLARVLPAAAEVEDAIAALQGPTGRASGRLRLTVPRVTASLLIEPLVAAMRSAHPDVQLEVAIDDALSDLVGDGFDAGIRIGDRIQQDMVSVRLTTSQAWSIVGAPAYFAAHGRPQVPEDLRAHQAINQRMLTSGTLYRWELEQGDVAVSIDVPGSIVVDDVGLLVGLCRRGLGLAYVADHVIAADVAAGTLERVLEGWLTRGPGLSLYFPERTQKQPKLRALIDVATTLFRTP